MKKKIALLGVLGAAGALVYALEAQYQRNKTANAENDANKGLSLSEDDSATASINENRKAERQTDKTASMSKIENSEPSIGDQTEHAIDDQGTDQSEASQILRSIRDKAFEASDEKLALALGRTTQEIEELLSGEGLIDGDVIIKARTLAMERGIEVR